MKARTDELIRSALVSGDDCPAPEAYLDEELARLSTTERERLEAHADACPRCGGERELARAFDAAEDALGERQGELARVVAGLEAGGPLERAEPTTVRPLRARAIPTSHRFRSLAAAAVVALAAWGMWLAFRSPGPDLPSVGTGTVLRGATIELEAPLGDLDERPSSFRWIPFEGGARHRVRLTAVDGAILWETEVSEASAELPENVGQRLQPLVVYFWQVEALDAAGKLLARSERSSFRMRPAGGSSQP